MIRNDNSDEADQLVQITKSSTIGSCLREPIRRHRWARKVHL
ncbi:hypothetical protein SynPROS91_01549 [Synechococcus sp. PROS-9-1]|nr:hypothetical protein SynPROS91_01549 [Synechococcus sp. PROS-9-1]